MRLFVRFVALGAGVGLASFNLSAFAQNLLTNPGFEQGGDKPAAWTISGENAGKWASPGHLGQRCLAVSGDGKSSSYWRSDDLSLQPGGLYRLRFWGRRGSDASGGCVVSGPSRVNHDFQFTETWQPYSFVFTVPADGARDFIRLGQWEQKGTAFFDDVELVLLTALSAGYGKGLELGDGESIESGVYRCVIRLGGPGGNYHRALSESRCGFNSDRWTFSAGQQVTYAHRLSQGAFTSGRLKVDMNYYVGGALKIEASDNGATWTVAGVMDGAHRGGEVSIPAAALSSGNLYIRLTGEGSACNLQVNGYALEVALKETPGADVRGRTFFLENQQTCPELEIVPEPAWWRSPSGAFEFRLSAKNASTSALDLRVLLTMDGETKLAVKSPALLAGEGRRLSVAIQPTQPGVQEAVLTIKDARNRTLYAGRTVLSLGVLEDPRPGYWLADQPDLGLWWCESGWKIGRAHGLPQKPARGKAQPVSLSAARGEFEAAQVILNPRKPMELLAATVGPLRDRHGRPGAISAELMEVAYVKVTRPTDPACEPGWYPDPLPPLRLPSSWLPRFVSRFGFLSMWTQPPRRAITRAS